MSTQNIIILNRNVNARLVPSGALIQLLEGTEVTITQSLGDTFTVNVYGNLARIDSVDADALGKESTALTAVDLENAPLEEVMWAQLKTCFDPEIPVNIVDLGLVYECHLHPLRKNEHQALVKMTLTAPGCGMGPVLAEDVKRKLLMIPRIKDAQVEIVFDPPWDRAMMSDAAKLQLGLL